MDQQIRAPEIETKSSIGSSVIRRHINKNIDHQSY